MLSYITSPTRNMGWWCKTINNVGMRRYAKPLRFPTSRIRLPYIFSVCVGKFIFFLYFLDISIMLEIWAFLGKNIRRTLTTQKIKTCVRRIRRNSKAMVICITKNDNPIQNTYFCTCVGLLKSTNLSFPRYSASGGWDNS